MILVTEDDAQNGPDHVDAHRTIALAISPWTQHPGQVDHTHYDTASMVGTAEDLLGLPPMGIVDARVNLMWGSFRSKPDETPYTAIQPEGDPLRCAGSAGQRRRGADGGPVGVVGLHPAGRHAGDRAEPRHLEVRQGPRVADARAAPREDHRHRAERRRRRLRQAGTDATAPPRDGGAVRSVRAAHEAGLVGVDHDLDAVAQPELLQHVGDVGS